MSDTNTTDHLLLKWRTLKGWKLSSPAAQDALREFFDLGASFAVMLHRPTDRQKELLCIMIDECNGEIWNDWDGVKLTKDEAKSYVWGGES